MAAMEKAMGSKADMPTSLGGLQRFAEASEAMSPTTIPTADQGHIPSGRSFRLRAKRKCSSHTKFMSL